MPEITAGRRATWDAGESPSGCPYCRSAFADVITTIWRERGRLIWRYRQCRACSRRFRTDTIVHIATQ